MDCSRWIFEGEVCNILFLGLHKGSFAVYRKTFPEVGFDVDIATDKDKYTPVLNVWDLFPEAKKVFERNDTIADDEDEGVAFGCLRDFFRDSNFENLRKELKKEYKDRATFNWLVANKILQPLSGGHVFIDKIPKDVDKSKCDKVTYPGSEKIIKGLAFGFEEGYHGVPDMVICPLAADEKGDRVVTVVNYGKDCDEDEEGTDGEGNSPAKTVVEGKKARGKFILDDMSQCIATITTFAFIQQIRHPHELQIYPMLMISAYGVVMLLYNPNTDILLTSEALSWDFDISFLVIWLSLHYHSLSIGEGPKADDLKCGFKKVFEEHVDTRKYIYLEPSFKVGLKEKREVPEYRLNKKFKW